MASATWRSWLNLRVLVRVAVPLLSLGVLLAVLDGPGVLNRLLAAEWPWLAAALVASNVQILLLAKRWQLTASQLGQQIPTGPAIREYYLAQLLNQILPGGMIGDAGRAVRSRHEVGLLAASQAVVAERMAGQIALFTVMFAAFGFAFVMPGGLTWPWAIERATLTLGGGVILLAAAWIAFRPVVRAYLPALSNFAAAIRIGLLAPGVWPRQIVLGLAVVACNLATFAFCARATGTILPMEAVLTLIPLILTAMILPVSIGGWGVREGAAAVLFPLAGASPESGIAASVSFGVVILVASLPGALWLTPSAKASR